MFWCYENGDGNLAVAYASEALRCVTIILVIKIGKLVVWGILQ